MFITFSESVSGFTVSDIIIHNGVVQSSSLEDLGLNADGSYSYSIDINLNVTDQMCTITVPEGAAYSLVPPYRSNTAGAWEVYHPSRVGRDSFWTPAVTLRDVTCKRLASI